jgi:carbonic anhydrase
MKNLLTYFIIPTFAVAGTAFADLPPTAEQQKALTPASVLQDLMAGNKRFMEGKTTAPNITERIAATSTGQFPKAYILSCVDSRVPVELVFDQGIGDIFVGRVAGNVESVDQLGSAEFATKVAGAKVLMVLGHEACGAVKGACDGAELGNLTALLDQIEPAVKAVEGFEDDQKNSKNKEFVEAVIEKNVKLTVADVRKNSPVLAELEKAGDIKIVGALYSLQDGSVTILETPAN